VDLDLDDDQRAVREAFGSLFAKFSSPDDVRAAEPTDFDPRLWARLVETGAPTMAVPAAAGGGGGALLDLALVAEERGRYLAPVPLTEGAVAARLLAACGARGAVDEIAAGERVATVALHPAVDGVARLVGAGTVADLVVALDGEELVLAASTARPPARPAAAFPPGSGHRLLGAGTLADRPVVDGVGVRREVLATGAEARRRWHRAVDEWKTLTAAALAGLARGALELTVDYVRERRQFGSPIGAFQSVAHRLVDVATEVEGVRLVALETAWTADHDPARLAGAAASAFALAAETAQRTAALGLHFHGGYGFMLEYDIQLYFRRAKAWTLAYGDPEREYGVAALAFVDGLPTADHDVDA
jgi:alkylation response protein AidB-like acyl-CoA dehydrogenase